MIYHAEWCRVCKLLLEMLCETQHDPLRHPAVKREIQPVLKGMSMRDWTAKGWKFTDENWPFGHGEQRYEGATYILGPLGVSTASLIKEFTYLAIQVGAYKSTRNPKPVNDISRDYRRRREQKEAKGPKTYPLSCLVTIATDEITWRTRQGLLFVNLIGYGRTAGADVQVLSHFRLAAISTNTHQLALPAPMSEPINTSRYVHGLDRNWINPISCCGWLHQCETQHGATCSQFNSGMRNQ